MIRAGCGDGCDSSRAHKFDHDDAPGTATRDPAPDVKPSGTTGCKNACSSGDEECGIPRNNPDDHNSGSNNLHGLLLRAGPRKPAPTQLTATPAHVHGIVPDNAGSAHADVRGPFRSPGSDGSTANDANDTPLPGNRHCNNAIADAPAGTVARSLSANNDAAGNIYPLAAN